MTAIIEYGDFSQSCSLGLAYICATFQVNIEFITVDKHSEDELLRCKAIVESVIDGIITIGMTGVIQTVNAAACTLFGYSREEMLGRTVNMLMPEPHQTAHDGYIKRHLDTGEKRIIGIGRLVEGLRKDGSRFPFWLSVSALTLGGEKVFIGLIHDVSELKAAEEEVRKLNISLETKVAARTEELADAVNQLLKSNRNLEHEVHDRQFAEKNLQEKQEELMQALERERGLSELKSRFVAIASHEFRTPLSTILSSASLAQRYAERGNMEKQDFHLVKIKAAVNHLTGILNDFLNMTKLEEGRVQNTPESFDLAAFLQEIVEEMSGLAKPGQCVIFESKQAEIPVFLDKNILKHILYNLISNGLKYSSDTVVVFAEKSTLTNHIIIAVRDKGIGIPKAEQAMLFERFFRARNAVAIQGTGLGLNIVKHYVALLGGTVHFTSEENAGTEFTLQIPNGKD